jgi:hypothetical protein
LAKDLKRVRGGGGSDGALDEARGKMRDSAAAAAATEEMREAAARHRDMISLAFASLVLRKPLGGGEERWKWLGPCARGPAAAAQAARAQSPTRGPSCPFVRSFVPRHGLDGVQSGAAYWRGAQNPNPNPNPTIGCLSPPQCLKRQAKGAAIGEVMELMPSSRSFLSSCNRKASSFSRHCRCTLSRASSFIYHLIALSLIAQFCLAILAGLVAPSRTALADPRRKGRRGTVW